MIVRHLRLRDTVVQNQDWRSYANFPVALNGDDVQRFFLCDLN